MTIFRVTVEYPKCLFPTSVDARELALAVCDIHQIVLSGQKLEVADLTNNEALSFTLQVREYVRADERGMLMLIGFAEKIDAYLVGRVGAKPNSEHRRFGSITFRENESALEVELPTRLFRDRCGAN